MTMHCPQTTSPLHVGALLFLILPCRVVKATAPETSSMTKTAAALTPTLCRSLADETDKNLRQQVLSPWFPRAIDKTHGGFYESFDEEWKRPNSDPNTKSIVYQSRLTWVAAKAALRYPDQSEMYRAAALHGLSFLSETLWDTTKGGFYWNVSEAGVSGRNSEKHAYGIAFAIYAASAVYEATHDAHALDLAKRAYAWLETHAHDSKNGGFYEALDRDGVPILTVSTAPGAVTADPIGMRYG